MNTEVINEVATQVQALLTKHANAKAEFERHVNKFNAFFLEYWKSTQATMAKIHCESQRQQDKKSKSQQNNPRLWKVLKILDTVRKNPIVPNPVNWEIEDKWTCRYMTLAVVHDIWIEVDNPAPVYLCKNIVDVKLFGYMKTLIEEGWGVYSGKAISQSLAAIKTDLPERSCSDKGHTGTSFLDEELTILYEMQTNPNLLRRSSEIAAACNLGD
jgi:hypothetical protein